MLTRTFNQVLVSDGRVEGRTKPSFSEPSHVTVGTVQLVAVQIDLEELCKERSVDGLRQEGDGIVGEIQVRRTVKLNRGEIERVGRQLVVAQINGVVWCLVVVRFRRAS